MKKNKLTGAEIIWECLIREGVDVVFGYPGGAILPTYDALSKYKDNIHHVLTRHEQGATHMADGYARTSGKVGVAMATSGPGAANMVTGLATAMMDSVPIVCITGQVPRPAIGSDAFQEMDISGAVIPVTKHSYLVMDIKNLAQTIKEAFAIARSGRPGPVLIDIPNKIAHIKPELIDSLIYFFLSILEKLKNNISINIIVLIEERRIALILSIINSMCTAVIPRNESRSTALRLTISAENSSESKK